MEFMGLDLRLSRAEAKKAGDPFYFSGKPCSNGHITKRHVAGGCYECNLTHRRENMRRARIGRPEEIKVLKKADYARNREKRMATVKAYAKKNKTKINASAADYRKRNPEVHREISATRRARCRNATPPWLTKAMREEIKAMHREASALKDQFGVRFDIDHVVPLDGRVVCGLHVPWNMRVITHDENSTRSKIFTEPDLGRCVTLPLGCGAVIEHYQLSSSS